MANKPRVVYEQYVLAHYSVPLYEELAKYTDLTIVVSEHDAVDGVKEATDNLPFKIVRLKRGGKRGLFHPGILEVLKDTQADVYISLAVSLDRILTNRKAYRALKSLGVKIIMAGCDGYMYKNHRLGLIKDIINPRSTIRTLRNILALSRVDNFLIYSRHSADYLKKARFVPTKKILVTHNAIDTSTLNQTFHRLRDSGQHPKLNKIVYCGRLTPRKRPVLLVEAFGQIQQDFPDATLDILGEGSEREKIEKKIWELGLQDKVSLLGGVYDDREIASYLSCASLFVMPGLGGLGFNTAMACGLPIIYTDADGTEKDMFADKNCAWYFDGSLSELTNKIREALSNPEEMKRRGKIMEHMVTDIYNIKNMVDIYRQAFK